SNQISAYIMSEIKVFAPATVSNLACGFDLLGFPIFGPGDEIIARLRDQPGVEITKITGAESKLPLAAEKNTAGVAALAVLKHLGIDDKGMTFQINKKMPIGSGMGSSAASAVAGAFAANELLGRPLSKIELLRFASAGEQIASGGSIHLDNVAPCLLGGITLNRSNQDFDVLQIPVPERLICVLVFPEIQILTAEARSILSSTVLLKKHIEQSANLGGLVTGFFTKDLSLIQRSLKDVIIEPQRSKLIPGFYDVQQAALEAGALGCSISGAGPSIFALCSNDQAAKACGEGMQKAFKTYGIESRLFISPINEEGVRTL
ncbi:MAG: homoserine kinase, partial [Bacteroidota bacterium]